MKMNTADDKLWEISHWKEMLAKWAALSNYNKIGVSDMI